MAGQVQVTPTAAGKVVQRAPVPKRGQVQKGTVATADTVSPFIKGLDARKQEILAEPDPLRRKDLLTRFTEDTIVKASGIQREIAIRNTTESTAQELHDSIKERQEEGFFSFQTFIDALGARAGLRPQSELDRRNLVTEMARVEANYKREVTNNPDINAINALHSDNGFIAGEQQNIVRMQNVAQRNVERDEDAKRRKEVFAENRTLTNDAQNALFDRQQSANKSAAKAVVDARKVAKDEVREQQDIDLANSVTNNQRIMTGIVLNKEPNDPSIPRAAVERVMRNPDFKAAMAVADSPTAVVDLWLDGNATARTMALHSQARNVSGTTDRTSEKYTAALSNAEDTGRMMTGIVSNSIKREKAIDLVYGSKESAGRKAWEKGITDETFGMNKSAAQAVKHREYKRLAIDAVQTIRQADFNENISSWGDMYLGALGNNPIYTKLVEQKGANNIGVQDMISSIQDLVNPVERAQAIERFSTAMHGAALEKNKAYFGFKIDTINVQNTINQAATRSIVGDLLDQAQSVLDPSASARGQLEAILRSQGITPK